MTQDEIIEMAKQVGFWKDLFSYLEFKEHLEAFAKLVEERTAAKEREACAELEKNLAFSPAMFPTMAEYRAYRDGVLSYREAIRARAQAERGEQHE